MYYVYIIRSIPAGRYYTGSTGDWRGRLRQHNSGKVRSTKAYTPWELVHLEEHQDRTEARKRELQMKRFKGGDALRRLVQESLAQRE